MRVWMREGARGKPVAKEGKVAAMSLSAKKKQTNTGTCTARTMKFFRGLTLYLLVSVNIS